MQSTWCLRSPRARRPKDPSRANALGVDDDLLRHTAEREVAFDFRLAVARDLYGLADERCFRELADIQEVSALQVLVALAVVGVDARRVDFDGHFRGTGVCSVIAERAREGIEAAGKPAEAQMLDLEVIEAWAPLVSMT